MLRVQYMSDLHLELRTAVEVEQIIANTDPLAPYLVLF